MNDAIMEEERMRQAPLFIAALGLAFSLTGCQTRTAHPLPDACYQKPDTGHGRAAIPRFYYDSTEESCKSFIWGGSQGSVPFETLGDCIASCYAPAPESLPERMAPRDDAR
jgi:hypothetical protein